MQIEHIAVFTQDLERLRSFYETYFQAEAGAKYTDSRHFESYFLTFDSGSRLELMSMPGIMAHSDNPLMEFVGYSHMAISVGSKERVDELTARLGSAGYFIVGRPMATEDGYYESCVLDPDGNRVEITI